VGFKNTLTIKINNMKIKSIKNQEVVLNYPYGRLQCQATFSLEFNKSKGFRNIFQTINPKNGRVNAPKKSTYSDFQYMFIADNGHIKFGGFGISGYDDVNKVFQFIHDNEKSLELTPEMLEYLYIKALACIKGNAYYSQCDTKELLKVLESPIKTLVKLLNKENGITISDIFVDVQKIEQLKLEYINLKNK
jgi:hypothetical protein